MAAFGDLATPVVILGAVVLTLLAASRLAVFAARLGIWLSGRVSGPEELYTENRAAGGLLPRYGRARTALVPRGKVFVAGEVWDAQAQSPVPAGTRVEVLAREGLELRVRSAPEPGDHEIA